MPDLPKPKRLFLLGSGVLCSPEYASPSAIKEIAQTLRDIGISYVPSQNRLALLKQDLPDSWSEVGFKFYSTQMEPMDFTSTRNTLPLEEDYLVGMDGVRAKGSHPDKFHGRIYCPLSLSTPGRSGFERMFARALEEFQAGAEWVDFDLEPPVWTSCFCEGCLREFAEFSAIPHENVVAKKPFQLMMTYPETWYRFRSTQTARFYTNFRKILREKVPHAKVSANTLLVDLDRNLGNLGPGYCHFAEHPAIVDAAVDLHTIDALTGSVHDPISTDVLRTMTTKPIIGTAGMSYCVGYSHACIVGRRIQAEQRGRPLGYDRRGDLLRLGIVHSAASGALGIRVPLQEQEEPIDAKVAQRTADATRVLARVEDDYLDGIRHDDLIEVIDLTEPTKEKDPSIIAGEIWKHFRDGSGEVQYRVHRGRGRTLVSLFNWNPQQDQRWLVRLKKDDATVGAVHVSDWLTEINYRLQGGEGGDGKWSPSDLKEGIVITVPSADFVILCLGSEAGHQSENVISQAERKRDLANAATRNVANREPWKSNAEHDLRESLVKGIQRGSQHLLPGTIPAKYLKK